MSGAGFTSMTQTAENSVHKPGGSLRGHCRGLQAQGMKEGESVTIFPKSKGTWFHQAQKIQLRKHSICCHHPVSKVCTCSHYTESQSVPPAWMLLKSDPEFCLQPQ